MMRYRRKISVVLLLVACVLCTGQLYVSATEIGTESTAESVSEENATEESITEEDSVEENITEESATEESTVEENIAEESATEEKGTEASIVGENSAGESTTEEDSLEENTTAKSATEEKGTETSAEENTTEELAEFALPEGNSNGLYYYLNQYQYDCKVTYMEKYVSYIAMEVAIYQEMYDMGEVTETVLNSCEAKKSVAEAELTMAQNERAYYELYLTENGLNYSDFDVKQLKSIQSLDYYKEHYPEKDSMVFARYVTDYNNAVLGIESKSVEVEAWKDEVSMAELLVQEGELSEWELEEKKLSLAQAEYELEQYYVQMNMAYYNITQLTGMD